jgi:SPASM domain peptide maturase of grasp-with-spasm system
MIQSSLFYYFKKCADVLITEGVIKDVLIDSTRNEIYCIPKSLTYILLNVEEKNLSYYLRKTKSTEQDILLEYIEFIIKNELVIFAKSKTELKSFKNIKLDFFFPAFISNLIIEINDSNLNNLDYYLVFINKLLVTSCLLVISNILIIQELINFLDILAKKSKLLEIQLIFNFDIDIVIIKKICINCSLINLVTISSKNSILKNINIKIKENIVNVFYLNNYISNNLCGVVNKVFFSINLLHFTESQHHNTCLNRKLSIDAEGNIKNCPSLPEVYGNINDPDLDILQIVESKEFQKYWNIKKDDIKICQVCEFRHVCTDCRAYREDPDDLYSKPLKCGYDPYTGEWEEWSTHPMKQKAIKFYGMEELVKKSAEKK